MAERSAASKPRAPRKPRARPAAEAQAQPPQPPPPPPPPPLDSAPIRGRLPQLDAADAETLRGFFARQRQWALADGGLLRLQLARGAGPATVTVDADDDQVLVQFDAGDGGDDAPPDWSDYAGRARALAWGLAHEGQLARLGEAFGARLRPADGDRDDAPGGASTWLEFWVDEDPEAIERPVVTRGQVGVPLRWLDRLARRAEPRYDEDPAPPLDHWRDLLDSVAFGFSIAPLSQRDWRTLRPGDVIVVGRSNRPPQFHATAAHTRWPLSPTAAGWRVEGAGQPAPQDPVFPIQDRTRMTENETPAPEGVDAAPEDPARNLPVRVAFEIGRVELSVGEIADLQPGYVFALPSLLEGANVTILANGHAAGRGEVVAVGDTLGVRLLSWA